MLFRSDFTFAPRQTAVKGRSSGISVDTNSYNDDVSEDPVPAYASSIPESQRRASVASRFPFFRNKRPSFPSSTLSIDSDIQPASYSRITKVGPPTIITTGTSGESDMRNSGIICIGVEGSRQRSSGEPKHEPDEQPAATTDRQLAVPTGQLTPPTTPVSMSPKSVGKSARKSRRPPPLNLKPTHASASLQAFRPVSRSDEVASPLTCPKSMKDDYVDWEESYMGQSASAIQFGLQLLVQTLNEIPEQGKPAEGGDQFGPLLEVVFPMLHTRNRPSTPRLETSMPSINEDSEAGTRPSTGNESLPLTPASIVTPLRRGSYASTLPTSVSGMSLLDPPDPDWHQKVRKSSAEGLSLFPADFSSRRSSRSLPTENILPGLATPSEAVGTSSRHSSLASFFCRGSRTSALDERVSIGLGSLCSQDIDLEENLDDLSHYPGIDAFKNQLSWLSQSAAEFSEEEEEEEEESDEESYHKQLAVITMSIRKPSVEYQKSSLYTYKSQDIMGAMLQTPPPRRTRRRTASSECIFFETLQGLEKADAATIVSADSNGTVKRGHLGDINIPFGGGEWDGLWRSTSDLSWEEAVASIASGSDD